MELDLRPKLEQDLEASCKYPSVFHSEVQSELHTAESVTLYNNRTTVWTVLQPSLPVQSGV